MALGDCDADLRERLARLAASVPVAPSLSKVQAGLGDARPRARVAWFAPVVALVVVGVGSLLVNWPAAQPGASADGSPGSAVSSASASSSVHATAASGDFLLEIESSKSVYLRGEPIEITGHLTYLGREATIVISHGHGSPMSFGVVEPVDGLKLSPGWRLSCERTELQRGMAVSKPFTRSGGFDGSEPRASAFKEFMEAPDFELPTGTWHPYVVASFSVGDCSPEPIRIRAEIEIQVVEGPSSADPTDALSPVATGTGGSYSIEVGATKRTYAQGEPIGLAAGFRYNGAEPKEVAALWGPTISIVEPVFGMNVRDLSATDAACPTGAAMLESGQRIERHFRKSADVEPADPEYEAKRAFLEDPVLRLPPGTWHVRAQASVLERCSSEPIVLVAEIEILVAASSSTTAAPLLDGDLPSIDGDGTFVLEIAAGGTTYWAGEQIGLGASYWYVGSEERVDVSHLEPELEYTITELGVDGQLIRNMVYDSACTVVPLRRGVRRSVSLFQYNTGLITAASWPPSTATALDNGRLQLPPGQWRVAASLSTSVGGCTDRGAQHELRAEVDLTVLP